MPLHESSMRNLAKARQGGPPRPWRSCDESRIIRRYAFLWYTARGKRPSGRDWARQPGSHTCLQKLVREFTADPSKMWRYRQREAIPDLQNSAGRESTVRLMKEHRELRLSHLARMAKFFER